MQHPNARLTPTGRRRLVGLVEERRVHVRGGRGRLERGEVDVSAWVRRWRPASDEQRRSLACLQDRSLAPRTQPADAPRAEHQRICAARRRTGWGPRLIASEVGHPHSTVHATLQAPRPLAPATGRPGKRSVRYEWPCPGELLHIDTSASSASRVPATRSPDAAAARAPRSACGSATSSRTQSSTTTAPGLLRAPPRRARADSGRASSSARCASSAPTASSPSGCISDNRRQGRRGRVRVPSSVVRAQARARRVHPRIPR